MPLHDVGYRGWDEQRTPTFMRWWIITKTGVRLAFRSHWVKRSLLAAWLPILYWGAVFLIVENAILQDTRQEETLQQRIEYLKEQLDKSDSPEESAEMMLSEAQDQLMQFQLGSQQTYVSRVLGNWLAAVPQANKIADAIASGESHVIRQETWRWLFMTFFRYPQALMLIFLIGAVAPGLISRDIRSRAFLLYFAKPIGRWEYIVGKLMIPAVFLVGMTTLPALVLFLLAILASPDLSVLYSTWDIPFRILLASVSLVIPTCSIALMLSSLTQESRFASFSWFAVWVLGHGAYFAVMLSAVIRLRKPPFSPEVMSNSAVKNWSSLSLYNCLGDAQTFLFGFSSFEESWKGMLVLVVITIVSLGILYRRVSSPVRV
ncbi:MAG: ABC transporter permease subunit [Planctomycetota bacterium]